ncbi:MAG: putative pyridoxal phosphate-dependent protein [Ignavibacteria bacterium]|nr:putative pyridoxal phosphate-dependent protein [Ignavibacteria bacterium]
MYKIKIPLFRPAFTHEDGKAIADVLKSGHLTTGVRCAEFEKTFANRLNVKYAVSTSSCTTALHLALFTANVGSDDIVFLPSLTFIADIQVIEWLGAIPVLIDCDPNSFCIDPLKLRQTIISIKNGNYFPDSNFKLKRCRAIIAVDYAGQMADYANLRKICNEYDMILIEDAAHALPSCWREDTKSDWLYPGELSDVACFSFYPNKSITTGEGGMVVTNDKKWADRMKSVRSHGFEQESYKPGQIRQVIYPGLKCNLSDLSAALGLNQLLRLEDTYHARREIAHEYTRILNCSPLIELPKESPNRLHSWHLYVIKLVNTNIIDQRDLIIKKLYKLGIETSIHYYPIHLHQFYKEKLKYNSDLSVSESIYRSIISLPIFPSMTKKDIKFVAINLLRVINEVSKI